MALFTQRRPRRFRYEANSALSQLSHNEDEQNNETVSDDNGKFLYHVFRLA